MTPPPVSKHRERPLCGGRRCHPLGPTSSASEAFAGASRTGWHFTEREQLTKSRTVRQQGWCASSQHQKFDLKGKLWGCWRYARAFIRRARTLMSTHQWVGPRNDHRPSGLHIYAELRNKHSSPRLGPFCTVEQLPMSYYLFDPDALRFRKYWTAY